MVKNIYATMGWQILCNDGMAALICNNGMANNMQQWDGEECATMGWRIICNNGMANNMQQWDGSTNMQQWDLSASMGSVQHLSVQLCYASPHFEHCPCQYHQ